MGRIEAVSYVGETHPIAAVFVQEHQEEGHGDEHTEDNEDIDECAREAFAGRFVVALVHRCVGHLGVVRAEIRDGSDCGNHDDHGLQFWKGVAMNPVLHRTVS